MAINRRNAMSLQNTDSTELDDYSGAFEPDLRLDDFSKEALKKLVEIGGTIYGAVNRAWYAAVAERYGKDVADEMHHEVWFKDGGVGDVENYTISALMGFSGEDEVTTPMKVWQCLPAMASRMKLCFEQVGPGQWQMYTPMCVVPETGERGGPDLMNFMVKKICGHLELFGFRHGAARWNSHIRIDPLRLPPRKQPSEPHCRWTIEMRDEEVDYAIDPGPYVVEHNLQFEKDRQIVNHEAGKYARGAPKQG
jgi:hypothetical protein